MMMCGCWVGWARPKNATTSDSPLCVCCVSLYLGTPLRGLYPTGSHLPGTHAAWSVVPACPNMMMCAGRERDLSWLLSSTTSGEFLLRPSRRWSWSWAASPSPALVGRADHHLSWLSIAVLYRICMYAGPLCLQPYPAVSSVLPDTALSVDIHGAVKGGWLHAPTAWVFSQAVIHTNWQSMAPSSGMVILYVCSPSETLAVANSIVSMHASHLSSINLGTWYLPTYTAIHACIHLHTQVHTLHLRQPMHLWKLCFPRLEHIRACTCNDEQVSRRASWKMAPSPSGQLAAVPHTDPNQCIIPLRRIYITAESSSSQAKQETKIKKRTILTSLYHVLSFSETDFYSPHDKQHDTRHVSSYDIVPTAYLPRTYQVVEWDYPAIYLPAATSIVRPRSRSC